MCRRAALLPRRDVDAAAVAVPDPPVVHARDEIDAGLLRPSHARLVAAVAVYVVGYIGGVLLLVLLPIINAILRSH